MTNTGTAATPRTFNLRQRARSWSFWVIVVLVSGVISSILLWPATTNGLALDPSNPRQRGMKALAQVLGQEGVSVTSVHSVAQASALGTPLEPTTLVISRLGYAYEEGNQLRTLVEDYAHVVVLGDTRDLFPDEISSRWLGEPPVTLEANCPTEIVGQATALRSQDYLGLTSEGGAQICFNQGDTGLLAHFTLPSGTVVDVLVDEEVFTNARILEGDAAALGLTLMGRHRQLVWLTVDPNATPDQGGNGAALELMPPWFTPVSGLLIYAAIVAMIWQGRRLGRLVIEPLPVVVKAIETTLARGRMYHKTRASQRSLQALQRGTARRLAKRLALPANTDLAQLSDAAATASNRDPSEVWQLLTAAPFSDDDLVSRAQGLATLEQEVRLG